VYDLGGGTFRHLDPRIGEGVVESRRPNGDITSGANDFDQKVMDWISDEFKKEQGIRSAEGPHGLSSASRRRPRKAKCELSTVVQTEVNLPFITGGCERTQAPGAHPDPRQARVPRGGF